MKGLLFGTSFSGITQKLSLPDRLEENLNSLDDSRESIQCRLKPVHREFKNQQICSKIDTPSAFERCLWTLFYNDTSAMLSKTETLNASSVFK